MSRGFGEMLESIGQILKEQRLARGLELPQVVTDLRIKLETLEALEDDRFDDIGYQSYALGFLRSYSKYLGLDSDKLVEAAKNILSPTLQVEDDFIHVDEPTEVSTGVFFLMVIAAIVVVFVVWISSFTPSEQTGQPPVALEEVPVASTGAAPPLQSSQDQPAESIAPEGAVDGGQIEPPLEASNKLDVEVTGLPPIDGEDAMAGPDNAADNETGGDPAPLATPKVSISLHVARETWMRISNSADKVLFSSIVDLGTVYELNENEIYYIASRDAGAIEIMRNGVVVDTLGKDSEILARRALDASRYVNRP